MSHTGRALHDKVRRYRVARGGVGNGAALFLSTRLSRGILMIGWAITFLVVALVAALLGFGGVAGTAVEAAKLIFFVAIALFLISAVFGVMRGRSPKL